jgi:hypothetical protein
MNENKILNSYPIEINVMTEDRKPIDTVKVITWAETDILAGIAAQIKVSLNIVDTHGLRHGYRCQIGAASTL